MTVLGPEHVVLNPPRYSACIEYLKAQELYGHTGGYEAECRRMYQAAKLTALRFLISLQWLIGDASSEGVPVSAGEVARAIQRKRASYPSGASEFEPALERSGRTIADLEFEIRAELARKKIYERLMNAQPKIAQSHVLSYYERHRRRYRVSERIYFNIAEGFKDAAAARQLERDVAQGKRRLSDAGVQETLERRNLAGYSGAKRTLADAIFAAKHHVAVGPLYLNYRYYLFEVTRVTPAHAKPLASVRKSIERLLLDEQWRRARSRFTEALRRTWTARTHCAPAYVVPGCTQYGLGAARVVRRGRRLAEARDGVDIAARRDQRLARVAQAGPTKDRASVQFGGPNW